MIKKSGLLEKNCELLKLGKVFLTHSDGNRQGGLSSCEHCITASCMSGGGGGGGVNEIKSTVKGAKAREAQSCHCAGNGLL